MIPAGYLNAPNTQALPAREAFVSDDGVSLLTIRAPLSEA